MSEVFYTAFVCVMGISIVFIGLVCIVLLCKVMGILVHLFEGETSGKDNAKNAPAAPAVSPDPGPRGEVVAAIAAALAEELGEDVSAIRILSLKKIN